jgi:hypothetical protein
MIQFTKSQRIKARPANQISFMVSNKEEVAEKLNIKVHNNKLIFMKISLS